MNLAGLPSPPPGLEGLNGTVEDVATFLRVSPRQVLKYKDASPPQLPHFQDGRNIMFREEDVIDYVARGYVTNRHLKPGDAKEMARKDWREHLRLRSAYAHLRGFYGKLQAMEKRIDQIERQHERAIRGNSLDTEHLRKDAA